MARPARYKAIASSTTAVNTNPTRRLRRPCPTVGNGPLMGVRRLLTRNVPPEPNRSLINSLAVEYRSLGVLASAL